MSQWGIARKLTKSYLRRLNATRAASLVNRSFSRGTAAYSAVTGAGGGRMMGAAGFINEFAPSFYKGMRSYMWRQPQSMLTRGVRIGTAAGIVGGGAMMIGAGRSGQAETERRYGIRPGFSILGRETGERIRRDAGLE
jgi:hypothetical protein